MFTLVEHLVQKSLANEKNSQKAFTILVWQFIDESPISPNFPDNTVCMPNVTEAHCKEAYNPINIAEYVYTKCNEEVKHKAYSIIYRLMKVYKLFRIFTTLLLQDEKSSSSRGKIILENCEEIKKVKILC